MLLLVEGDLEANVVGEVRQNRDRSDREGQPSVPKCGINYDSKRNKKSTNPNAETEAT